tara:strand:+ start:1378 stop:2325 length:948 start_codon:yes stop_codon:yes gene_type:complete
MTIKIFTNEVAGGWNPLDLKDGLGGSEESIILFSEALVRKGYQISVFHTQKENHSSEYNGVHYFPREAAKCNLDDIFITFKDNIPWVNQAKGKVNIHWTADVERPWNTDRIDHFVNLSFFHAQRNLWVSPRKSKIIPLGIDLDSLNHHKQEKNENLMLYCSAPDRGLEQLLRDWENIRKYYSGLELAICYGNESNSLYSLYSLLGQDGIKVLGRVTKAIIEELYWKAKYWCLPLNRADSELFCLNAVKAQYCGAIPVVNKIGALKNTVRSYIPYDNFVKGQIRKNDINIEYEPSMIAMDWDHIVETYWLPLFGGK